MHHVARADVGEGVVAGTAFEAVGEAEPGDERVVALGPGLRRVIERTVRDEVEAERLERDVAELDGHALLHQQLGGER
ncbi:hypothetical protein D3C87_1955630 [compost metagenome]